MSNNNCKDINIKSTAEIMDLLEKILQDSYLTNIKEEYKRNEIKGTFFKYVFLMIAVLLIWGVIFIWNFNSWKSILGYVCAIVIIIVLGILVYKHLKTSYRQFQGILEQYSTELNKSLNHYNLYTIKKMKYQTEQELQNQSRHTSTQSAQFHTLIAILGIGAVIIKFFRSLSLYSNWIVIILTIIVVTAIFCLFDYLLLNEEEIIKLRVLAIELNNVEIEKEKCDTLPEVSGETLCTRRN